MPPTTDFHSMPGPIQATLLRAGIDRPRLIARARAAAGPDCAAAAQYAAAAALIVAAALNAPPQTAVAALTAAATWIADACPDCRHDAISHSALAAAGPECDVAAQSAAAVTIQATDHLDTAAAALHTAAAALNHAIAARAELE